MPCIRFKKYCTKTYIGSALHSSYGWNHTDVKNQAVDFDLNGGPINPSASYQQASKCKHFKPLLSTVGQPLNGLAWW